MGYQKQPMAICDVTQGGIWGCCLGGTKCQKNMGGGGVGQGSIFEVQSSMARELSKVGGWTVTRWKRSRWVRAPVGLHFSFILVWIKGSLHLLGSQEKHVVQHPVGLFALDPSRTPGPCQPVGDGTLALTISCLYSPS